jgi:hypothetical protein
LFRDHLLYILSFASASNITFFYSSIKKVFYTKTNRFIRRLNHKTEQTNKKYSSYIKWVLDYLAEVIDEFVQEGDEQVIIHWHDFLQYVGWSIHITKTQR